MDDGTDRTKQGLGRYGETLAARELTDAGMVLRYQASDAAAPLLLP